MTKRCRRAQIWRFPVLALGLLFACALAGCGGSVDSSDLIAKLQQRNGLTRAEAVCINDRLADSVDPATLRRIAGARSTAKLAPDDASVVRKVIETCVPVDSAPTAPADTGGEAPAAPQTP